jgi:hypothetical protein
MRWLVLLALMLMVAPSLAVPPGYRYMGSRVVSAGRVVYWYWNADHVEIGPSGSTFVAYMHARAADVNQERAYVAIVRCDLRAYRDVDARGTWQSIEDGEPIDYVWRAGCDKGLALQAAARGAKLGDPPAALTLAVAPSNTVVAQAQPKATTPPPEPADARRSDTCIRFAETRTTPAGDATITNTCAYPVEVSLCYKGGGTGLYDCPAPARGKLGDSLAPGVSHVLPEYRRGRQRGINAVACKGEPGSVFPKLEEGGRTGCF